jgi:ATP-binding cassette, subfamily C (CFTR/MRP), member 1
LPLPEQGPKKARTTCLPLPVTGLALQRMGYGCMSVGLRVKAALINAVCQKAFSMHSITQNQAASAVSFVASDITKVYDACLEIHYLWTAPFEAIAILGILGYLVGVYSLPGWGVIIIVSARKLEHY